MGIRPEQADFDAAELTLLAIAEAHRMLLTCGLLRDAALRIASRLRRPVLGGVQRGADRPGIGGRALWAGSGRARRRSAGRPAHGVPDGPGPHREESSAE